MKEIFPYILAFVILFLNQVFSNKEAAVYYKNFDSFSDFVEFILFNKYTKGGYKFLVRISVLLYYTYILLTIFLLYLKKDSLCLPFWSMAVMLVCTAIVCMTGYKVCSYRAMDIIKSYNEFRLKMILW